MIPAHHFDETMPNYPLQHPVLIAAFAEVIEGNDAQIALGTIVSIVYARSSVFCVEHPETKKRFFIRRSEVRSLL